MCRRGALMLILNVWHPDVLEFITSKRTMGRITNANISVGITDDFMEAVKTDSDWDLVFPDTSFPNYDELWDGNLAEWQEAGRPVVVHKTVKARDVWNNIIESAWSSAEPGVFFVERYNKMSNSWYFAPILCTNPCGEQGLPAWGVCNLGALNLDFSGLVPRGADLNDLINAVKKKGHSPVTSFDASVFNGEYVTGDVSKNYLHDLEEGRNDDALQQQEKYRENTLDLHNHA